MQIQVVGLSHVNALREALKRVPFPHPITMLHMLREVPSKKFVVMEDGQTQLDAALRAKLQAGGDDRPWVFSLIGGNAHHFLGLFRHPQPFDFILPSQPDLPLVVDAELIPYACMVEVMRSSLQLHFQMLAGLRNAVDVPIHHMESPPAIADSAYCRDELDPAFRAQYALQEIASPVFRYKLWRLHGDLFAAECRRLGIGFVPCPAVSVDADGFLRREFWADPLHANAAYGQLVLDQMAAIATGAA